MGTATASLRNNLFRSNMRQPLGQLPYGDSYPAISFTGAQAELAYATSALAVRRLLDDGGGFAVANLLRDLGGGADFDRAFLHRFQRPFAEFAAGR